jgi:hypothetical protein
MSDYKVETLNGLLVNARSCSELLEAVVPFADRILVEFYAIAPHLFFVTQDGEDGLLTFEPEALDRLKKDELAYRLRRFCALRGVKACVLLFTGKQRALPSDDKEYAGEDPMVNDLLLPVGVMMASAVGEFLGEATRVCIWKIDPATAPARLTTAWNVEASSSCGRFINLLGQGNELGYPVSDELLDRIVAHSQANLARHPEMRSVEKGKTAGELAFETDEGPGRLRLVEKDGTVYWIGLYSGDPMCEADKAQLLAQLPRQTGASDGHR